MYNFFLEINIESSFKDLEKKGPNTKLEQKL